MAKRLGSISSTATKNMKHPRKTKKRLAVKKLMLEARAKKGKKK